MLLPTLHYSNWINIGLNNLNKSSIQFGLYHQLIITFSIQTIKSFNCLLH